MQSICTSPSHIINFSHCWVSFEKLPKYISVDSDLQCIESSKIDSCVILETDILDRSQTSSSLSTSEQLFQFTIEKKLPY